MPGPRAIAVLALTATLAAAGCGGSGGARAGAGGSAAYAEGLNRTGAALAQRFSGLDRHTPPTATPAQEARALAGYETAVRATLARLRALHPPADVGALHARLIAAVGGYGSALRAARAGLRTGDPPAVLAVQGRLRSDVAATESRVNAILHQIDARLPR